MPMPSLLVRLGSIDVGLNRGLLAAEARVEQFGRGVQRTLLTTETRARAFQHTVGKGMLATGGAILAGFVLAEKGAIQFERAMRNVQTIATNKKGTKLTEQQFKSLSSTLLELSTRVPQTATQLAEGMYQVVSTGFQGAEAMSVLRASAIAASAGLTTTEVAVDGITTVLKAYGESGFHATDVSNVLFQAVNIGKFSFEGLSNSMGQFVALAATLHIPLNQAAAAMSTISLAGHNAEQSSTLLNRVLVGLINPSDALLQKMGELRLSLDDLGPTGIGLQGVLDKIAQSVGGNAQALQAFFPDVRELNGVLALTANNGLLAADTLSHFKDPVELATAAQDAFDKQSKSVAFQLALTRNEISKTGTEIGQALGPAIVGASKLVRGLVEGLEGMPGPVRFVLVAGTALVGVISLIGGASLLAVPKIVALRTALQEEAVAAETGALANATIGSGVTGMAAGFLGALPIIGAVGLALTVGAVLLGRHGAAAAETKARVEELAAAMREEADAANGATAATNAHFLAQDGLITKAEQLGVNLADLIQAANGDADALKRVNVQLNSADASIAAEKQVSGAQRVGQALSGLVEGGYDPAGDKINDFRAKVKALNQENQSAAELLAAEKEAQDETNNALVTGTKSAIDATGATAGLDAALAAGANNAGSFANRLAGLSNAQQSMFHALQGEAQKAVDVFKDTGSGSKAAGKSPEQKAQDQARAQLGLERALVGVGTAQRAVVVAQRELDDARDDAMRRSVVSRAEREVQAAYASSERAVFSLRHAEQALDDARRNAASGRTLAESQIAVARARSQAADASQAFAEAQQNLLAAQEGGEPAEIAKAQRAMTDARNSQREAVWATQDAVLALSRAQGENGTVAEGVRTAQLDVDDAQRQIVDSADSAAAALKSLAQVQRDLADNTAIVAAQDKLRDAVFGLREAVLSVTDAHLSLAAAQKDDSGSSSAAGGAAKVKKTMAEYAADVKKANQEQAQWANDLATIWGDPSKGGRAVAAELAKMGKDGVEYTHKLATEGGQDVEDLRQALATKAALGADEFNLALTTGLGNAKQAMATVLAAVAIETGMGVDEITKLLDALGLRFQAIADAEFTPTSYQELKDRGVPSYYDVIRTDPNTGKVVSHLGNVDDGAAQEAKNSHPSRAFAAGDVANGHEPQIGYATRIWAEPETQGESYIPHANDWRRARAVALWQHTGSILGQYAAGGVNTSAVRPKPTDFDGLRLAAYRGTTYRSAATAWQNLDTSLRYRGIRTYAAGGMSGSWAYNGNPGSAGGLALVVGPGAVKVDVRVAADVDLGKVAAVVASAVEPAFDGLVKDLNDRLTSMGY